MNKQLQAILARLRANKAPQKNRWLSGVIPWSTCTACPMHITDDKAVERLRIVIADDLPEMLDTVEQRLAPDYEIVGKVPDGLALVECACRLQPDLLVIDISMPKLNGIAALRQLRSRGIQTRAIILTNHDDEDLAREVLSLNAQGFVLKSRLESDLCVAVVEVLAGRIFISETLRTKLLKKDDQANPKGGTRLGPRNGDCLRSIWAAHCEGRNDQLAVSRSARLLD